MLGQSLVAEAVKIYVESYVGNSLADHEILCEPRTFAKSCVVENALVECTVRRLLKRLGAERTSSLSETTSNVIWKVLIDNEIFSTVSYAHFLEPVFLSDYVKFAQEASLYSAIAKADKRMLVLHDFIAPHEFTSSLTFSTKRWVQDGLAKAGMPLSDRARLSGRCGGACTAPTTSSDAALLGLSHEMVRLHNTVRNNRSVVRRTENSPACNVAIAQSLVRTDDSPSCR